MSKLRRYKAYLADLAIAGKIKTFTLNWVNLLRVWHYGVRRFAGNIIVHTIKPQLVITARDLKHLTLSQAVQLYFRLLPVSFLKKLANTRQSICHDG